MTVNGKFGLDRCKYNILWELRPASVAKEHYLVPPILQNPVLAVAALSCNTMEIYESASIASSLRWFEGFMGLEDYPKYRQVTTVLQYLGYTTAICRMLISFPQFFSTSRGLIPTFY